MIQKITNGLNTAGSIANDLLGDKEIRENVIKLGSRVPGATSAIVTFVNMPETTNLTQKAVVSLGVGCGTAMIAAVTMFVVPLVSLGAVYSLNKLPTENYSEVTSKYLYSCVRAFRSNANAILTAGCITAAAVGGYKGHHILTDAANNLMDQSHVSASEKPVLRP